MSGQEKFQADRLLARLVSQHKVPGLSITVLRDGRKFFQKGYGFADIDNKLPVEPDSTLFRVASASKPIAALALANMVAEGRILLDASFYTYVPGYPEKDFDFTIRQLAGHTAGIRGYRGKEYALNKPYDIREGTSLFRDDPLLFEPGKGFHYNSYGWVLVALAMEEASGIPFETYVSKKVLQPLGLAHTFPETNCPETMEIATFYTKWGRGFREATPVNNGYKLAAGGYLSTSADLASLGQWTLGQYKKNDKVFNQFLTSQQVNGQPTFYGLGWEVSRDSAGRPFVGHTGNGIGGYSNFRIFPREGMVFAILVNCTNPGIQELLDEAVAILIGSGTSKSI